MSDNNFFEEFFKKFNQNMNDMGHANLVIAGKTGVGKSTLINASFREDVAKTGMGKPITEEGDVKCYEKEGFPLRIYDTMGLELDEERRNKSINAIKKICQDGMDLNNPDRFIHAMWYCISSDSDRLEPYEKDYINSIAEKIPVILVVTKSFRKKHSEKLIASIEKTYPDLKAGNKVVVLAQDEDIEDVDEGETQKKAYGVDVLVEVTAQIMPDAAKNAWINAQKASMKLKTDRAQMLVIATAAASFGEGYIPLPFSDAMALVPTQLGMLAGITAIFGVSVTENILKSIVTSMAGTAGATFAGRTIVANLLKLVPGVGTAAGGTISGATASVLTTALGEAYIQIMKMIVTGEMKEKDLGSKEVQNKLRDLFKSKLKGK